MNDAEASSLVPGDIIVCPDANGKSSVPRGGIYLVLTNNPTAKEIRVEVINQLDSNRYISHAATTTMEKIPFLWQLRY